MTKQGQGSEKAVGGRPRLAPLTERVCVTLPEPAYKRLEQVAQQRGEPLAATVRRIVLLTLAPEP